MKPEYHIDEWKINKSITILNYFYLSGYIKGRSPLILEDEPAHTSKLISINFKTLEAETSNSIYKLGEYSYDPRGW